MKKSKTQSLKKVKGGKSKIIDNHKNIGKNRVKNISRGKFIVIDGIDGAGKATQTKILVEALRAQGKMVETLDFPRYYNNFFGAMIGQGLRGDFGDFLAVHPKIASVLYACDRLESTTQINEWLLKGKIVVADRYTSSNQIHQGGKCKTEKERKEFLNWLDKMEHEVLGVPRPDLIIYLSLPVAVSQSLLKKAKSQVEQNKKDFKKRYLKGAKDLAEENIEHMEASRKSAYSIIKAKNNWKMIECFDKKKGVLRSIEDIHREIYRLL